MPHGVALLVHLAHRADRHDRGVLEVLFLLLVLSLLGLELCLSKGVKVVKQLICGLIALVYRRAHSLERNALKLGRNIRDKLMRRLGVGVHVLYGDLSYRVALVGLVPREHFIHDDAQRIHIAARIRAFTARLLGRDIMYRPYGLTVILVYLVFKRGNAEVRDLDRAVAQHHDVLRLYIAVDYPALMCVGYRLRDLLCEMQHLAPRKRAAPVHILPQRDALHQLHDYVFHSVAVADIVHRHDIRMRQHRDSVRFGAEAAPELLVRQHILAHDLHRDVAVEPMVERLIYDGHAALADDLQNFVPVVKQRAYIFVVVFHILYSTILHGKLHLITATTVTLSLAPRMSALLISARQISSGS